jgi:mono/diheme cytochrome c family protein
VRALIEGLIRMAFPKTFTGPTLRMKSIVIWRPIKWLQCAFAYAWACLFFVAVAAVSRASSDDDFFELRVRPVLTTHCLDCHGAKKQEGGLRLDSRDAWMRGGDRGEVIVVGEPDKSLLIQAVRHDDPDLQMPPGPKKLTGEEIAGLEAWIKQGATDPRLETAKSLERMSLEQAKTFWSFQPLGTIVPPQDTEDRWSRSSIDRFIHWQLRQEGLSPVVDADRRTLIRRASFDLTGLPPTADEIRNFLQDTSESAFESLVERLLESTAYGERWGRHWLDVARYADTAGDGADYPVPEAGKYRDWVIQAFNRDKPFNEFIREQIAGDILAGNAPAEHYADLVTATGFLAIGKRYGYKASPDFQYLDFADVIDSLGRSLMGLSLGCARCHDHKYDPISAADYYALYGILESTQWAFPGGEEQKRPSHFPPLLPAAEVAEREKSKAEALARLDAEIASRKLQRVELDPDSQLGGVDLGFEAQSLGKAPDKPWFSAGPIEVTADAQSPFDHIHPLGEKGVRIGSGKSNDGLRYVFDNGLRAAPNKQMHFTIDFRSVESTNANGAFRFFLGRGVVESLALECSVTTTEFAIRNGNQWEVIRPINAGTWYTLQLTIDPASKKYSGSVGTRDDRTVFQDKQTGANWDGVLNCFICDGIGHVAGPVSIRDLDNLGLCETAFASPDSGPAVPRTMGLEDQEQMAKMDAEIKALTERRQSLSSEAAYPVAYGVSEGSPKNSRLQLRGEPQRLSDEVPRRNLEILGGEAVPLGAGSGRLELANWITQPTNPLTARVFVNRVWQWHFGQGLVASASDFGARGEQPTHPELLDWLAGEFIASGWSIKSLHRSIMNSRTYQLASVDDAVNLAADPGNRWYWRFSRRALDAESIRDAMLEISGRLDRTVPQSHPFPAVDTWAFTIHNPFHAVYDSNHRSVYLMVQRNRRHPYLSLFDAADPNQSVAARQPTTTPTQSLFLMNSPFVHQVADGFAQRIVSVPGDDFAKARWAFETAHGQIPEESVERDALSFVSTYRDKLTGNDPAESRELRAWSALARVLMTGNAFLYVD